MALADFAYQDMLPLGPDETEYRLLTTDGVRMIRLNDFFRDVARPVSSSRVCPAHEHLAVESRRNAARFHRQFAAP